MDASLACFETGFGGRAGRFILADPCVCPAGHLEAASSPGRPLKCLSDGSFHCPPSGWICGMEGVSVVPRATGNRSLAKQALLCLEVLQCLLRANPSPAGRALRLRTGIASQSPRSCQIVLKSMLSMSILAAGRGLCYVEVIGGVT